MTKKAPLQSTAAELAKYGRFGDTELLHVNKAELAMLEKMSPGGLTVNPVTGQKEAFLPFLIPLLSSAIPGLLGLKGATALLAGAAASGLGTWATTGDWKEGLKSGLLGFGLGGLGAMAKGAQTATTAAKAAKAAKTAASVGGQASTGLVKLSKLSNVATKAAYGQQGLASGIAGMAKAAPASATSIGNAITQGGVPNMVAQSNLPEIGHKISGDGGGLMGRLFSGAGDNPQMKGVQYALRDPGGAMKTAFMDKPLSVGLPLASAAYLMTRPGGTQSNARYTGPGAPKDRPPGGYQPRPRTINQYTGDYSTYGEGREGEHDWFNEQPQTTFVAPVQAGGIIPVEPIRMAGGGIAQKFGSRPVRGPGGPTDDKIPALLSNGEYVFSAKAVKNMGAGSTERGFKVLDNLHRKARRRKKMAPKRGSLYGPMKMMSGGPVRAYS